MKLLKNRFFVTVVAVAIFLGVFPSVLAATGHTDIIRSAISVASTPFRAVFGWAADGVSGFFGYFSSVDSLIKENEELKKELDEYREAAARAAVAEGENDYLRSLLGLTDIYTEMTFSDAKITGRQSGSYSVTYTLNRGTESGIEKNMAVITASGVAGYIRECGIGWSRAVLLTDPTSAVGVYCPRSGIYGIAEGSVSYRQDGNIIITGLTESADILVGDKLFTTGAGGIYPSGLEVGTVEELIKNDVTHTVTAVISPSVDFDSLTYVIIVTDYTVVAEKTEGSEG